MMEYVISLVQISLLVVAISYSRSRVKRGIATAINGEVAKRPETLDKLDSLEREIVEYLANNGGVAYQGEIGRALGIPKSTLHRAIARMAERGIVTVKRQGRYNLIALSEVVNREEQV